MTLEQAKQMNTAHCSKHKRELEVIYYCPDCDNEESNQVQAGVMPTAGSKPPLGVMPHTIWLEKRITELSRALYEHFTNGYYNDATYGWLMELYNIYRLRDKYVDEQQEVKGCSA